MPNSPLLIISDAPTAGTGFGRICADISSRVASELKDVYDLATVGYGGINSRKLPCHHYPVNMDDWIIPNLPEIWEDWAGKRQGVVMFISDPARLGWFSRPEMSAELTRYPSLKEYLLKPPFQKWIYAPVDASGPNDRLTFPLAQGLLGFDRILAYGKWGEDVIRRTLGYQESDKRGLTHLPHGLDTDVFYPRNRQTSRAFFFSVTGAANLYGKKDLIKSDETLIGIVGTNQARKDFGMALEAVASLAQDKKVRLWIHTDILERHWSIPALLVDFGIIDKTVVSLGHISDDSLSKAYSACDVVMGIAPEGFGYVHIESLACGTPCVTGSFGGGAELVTPLMRVDPVAYRYESLWACKRPVYDPTDWAEKAGKWAGQRVIMDQKYDWKNNWAGWENWFRGGIK